MQSENFDFYISVAIRTLHHNLDKLQDAADASDEEIDFLRNFLSSNLLQTLVEVGCIIQATLFISKSRGPEKILRVISSLR